MSVIVPVLGICRATEHANMYRSKQKMNAVYALSLHAGYFCIVCRLLIHVCAYVVFFPNKRFYKKSFKITTSVLKSLDIGHDGVLSDLIWVHTV